jgi:hypothetical protein
LVPSVFVAGQAGPFNVVVHEGDVFWLDRDAPGGDMGAVKMLPEAGGKEKVLASELKSPFGLAVDTTHVYWTAPPAKVLNRVARAGMGSFLRVQTNQDSPHGLALDDTHLFWANLNSGTIRRLAKAEVGKPGAMAQELASGQTTARMLSLDETHVYFTRDHAHIGRVPKVGGAVEFLADPETLASRLGNADLIDVEVNGLALTADWVYFRARGVRKEPPLEDVGVMFRVKKDGTGLQRLFDDRRAGLSFLEASANTLFLPIPTVDGEVWRFTDEGQDITLLNCQQEANPTSVSVSTDWIYWTNSGGGTIMRTRNR